MSFRQLFSTLLCALLANLAYADHQDARLGFKVATPKAWSGVPTKVDERWIVAKFVSDKSYFWTEKGGGWTSEHKPDMTMIAFVSEAIKERARVQKEKDKDGTLHVYIELDSPYKDYKDYMTRRYTGGGWYVAKEEETKVGDIGATCYEIKVEKMSMDGPKRILTWVYHLPDVDLAVQFECLEEAWPKLEGEMRRCFKSFKAVKRSGEGLVAPTTGEFKFSVLDLDKKTPEERKQWRQEAEKRTHEKAQKNLPEGWTAKQMGHFLVISHADERFTKAVVERAEAAWGWLDATFPFVGEKEYVRSPVLRICRDEPEYRSFYKGSDWSWNNVEITTYDDKGGKTSWQMESVNREIKNLWFEDRDRDLYFAMPSWLSMGLDHLIGMASVKQGQLFFATDYWNQGELKQAVREGKLLSPREIMAMDSEHFWDDFLNSRQGAALVGFLATGPASKAKQTKDVLSDYLKSLKAVTQQLKQEDEKAGKQKGEKAPTTEEEEDAYFKNQRQRFKGDQKRILDMTLERAFAGWSSDDWKKFEELYQKSIS